MPILRPTLPAASVAVAALLSAPLAHAQTSEVFTQNAQPVLLGDKVYLFGLPTRMPDGKVTYWDLVIDVDAKDDNGKPNQVSVASATKAERIKRSEFKVGTYRYVNSSNVCELIASPFDGRTEFRMNCYGSGAQESTIYATFAWYTGDLAGHPWEAEYVAAGINELPGAGEFAWGKETFELTANGWSCFAPGQLMSARQVGDQISLVNYGDDSQINCEQTFTKVVD